MTKNASVSLFQLLARFRRERYDSYLERRHPMYWQCRNVFQTAISCHSSQGKVNEMAPESSEQKRIGEHVF